MTRTFQITSICFHADVTSVRFCTWSRRSARWKCREVSGAWRGCATKQVVQAQFILYQHGGSLCASLFLLPWPHLHRTLARWGHPFLARLQGCSGSIRSMRPLGLLGVITVCASLYEKMAACKPGRKLLSQTGHSSTLNLDFWNLEQWANECRFKLPSLWNLVAAAWVGWYTF